MQKLLYHKHKRILRVVQPLYFLLETPGVIRSASGYFNIHKALQAYGKPISRISVSESPPFNAGKPPRPPLPCSPQSDATLLVPSTQNIIDSCTSIDQSFYDNVQPLALALVRSTEQSSHSALSTQAGVQPHEAHVVKRSTLSPNDAKNHSGMRLLAKYDKPRRAPVVSPELSEEELRKAPKMVTRKISHDSLLSTDSRESVMSATSFRAENKIRRYFNY